MAPCSSLLLLTIFTLVSAPPLAAAAASISTSVRAIVATITKDASSSLYAVALNSNQSFVIDLAGPLLWSACSPIHRNIPCNATECRVAREYSPPSCPRVAAVNRRPCTCTASLVDPITGRCAFDDLTSTVLTLSSTDGRNPLSTVRVRHVVAACAPRSLLGSLPDAAVGVAGLGRSRLALPSQLSARLSLKRQFAICLPGSGSAPGAAFFGNGPFYFLAAPPIDASALLRYTPLLRHPTNPGYFLKAKCIAVNGEAVPFLARVLEFDSLGHGGVTISAAVPYTTVSSHVYRPLLRAFAAATSGIPRRPKASPFGLCLKSAALGSTRVGYGVPPIDLMLEGGGNWTLFGANSMVQVDKETACLAIVDGGARAERAVVIGGYQMENSLVSFDPARSRLGFTSTLLGVQTTCSNFNFTR